MKLIRTVIALIFVSLLSSSIVKAQPLLQEKRIYLVDVTASMEGRGAVATPNIFDSVKDKLESTISHIADKTTEVAIIPFTSNTFPEYSGTIAQKDSLTSIISKLEVKRGDTNIADAWSKAVSSLDSTKINYIFLLTDGLHNCGPSKEELFSRLEEWGNCSHGKYYFAFYVMLTPNAKEQEICRIVDATPNIWLIESMDIDASLVKTNASIRKNVFNDNSVSVYFSSNNSNVELGQVGMDINMEDNPYYEIESISKSIMTDSYQLRLREKKTKMEMPLVDTLLFRISHNAVDYPFVFFTPDYFSAIISNQGPRCLKVTNHNVLDRLDAKIKFGKLKFHEPFQGPFKYLRKYLEPTLNYPPFSWLKPDTLSVSAQLYLTFNEEAVRSSSNLRFVLKDADNALLPDVELTCNNGNIINASNTEENEVNCSIKVLPGRESGLISGPFILHTSDLDYVNEKEISANDEVLCEWSANYKRKWALLLWLLWIICAAFAIAIAYFAVRSIIKLFVALIDAVKERISTILENKKTKKIKNKKSKTKKARKNMENNRENREEEQENPRIKQFEIIMLSNAPISQKCKELESFSDWWEQLSPMDKDELYVKILPEPRKILDRYWNIPKPSPNKHGFWVGEKGNSVFYFNKDYVPAEKNTRNGMNWGELVAEYKKDLNLKGDGGIKYSSYRIDLSDYSVASVKIKYEDSDLTKLRNRGGSGNTIQELAAPLFEKVLHDEIIKGGYSNFWEYKDGLHNGKFMRNTPLVIHEDYDGETLYLVPKYLHDNWKHYGGVALVGAIIGE